MRGAVEQGFIFHAGAEPDHGEIARIIGEVERATGVSLVSGTRISMFDTRTEPSEDLALALMARLEREGRLPRGSLNRVMTHGVVVNGVRRTVALIMAETRNDWVRELIPRHLAKLDDAGLGLAWRPGWAALSGEPALAFVAGARNGTARQFDDVQIMISILPETKPHRIQQLMPGGYTSWVNDVASAANVTADLTLPDIAHWILCADSTVRAVHLGYFAHSAREAMLPWDLLTPEEQQKTSRKA